MRKKIILRERFWTRIKMTYEIVTKYIKDLSFKIKDAKSEAIEVYNREVVV